MPVLSDHDDWPCLAVSSLSDKFRVHPLNGLSKSIGQRDCENILPDWFKEVYADIGDRKGSSRM